MTDFLLRIEGTEAGHTAALVLALMAAVLHALFGALQKGRHDPWLSRAAIDASYGLIALPFALFVVPWRAAMPVRWWQNCRKMGGSSFTTHRRKTAVLTLPVG